MRRADVEDLALLVGAAAVAAGVVWWAWPTEEAATSLGYAPAPEGGVSAPLPPFLAAAPPAGAARERYFEAAVDAPVWRRIDVGGGVQLDVAQDVVSAQGIRVPLWPSTAQRVADRYGAMLPTKKLVDLIYRAADVKLTPRSIQPHDGIGRNDLRMIADYDAMIDRAVAGRGGLIANAKKDVITGRTPSEKAVGPDPRVTIYGWIQSNGTPVQSASWVHALTYLDASHGIRLVSRTAYRNGVPVPIEQLFADPATAPLLNETGTLTPTMLRYPVAP